MKQIELRYPFAVRSFYSDCGNEFLNKYFIEGYIKADYRIEPLEYYRGRPYHKNDQCYIEQKNNTHIRELMGYARVEWKQIVDKMNNVYRKEWRQLQNFFYPQQRIVEKYRIASKLKRKMSPPVTPYERTLEDEDVAQNIKDKLKEEKERLNPFELQRKLKKKLQYINQLIRTTGEEPAKGKYVI